MFNLIEKFFGLSTTADCPLRTDCCSGIKGGEISFTNDHHGFYNLFRTSLPLAIAAACVNSLVAVAIRSNPVPPTQIALFTFTLSHAIDLVAHLANEKHDQSQLSNFGRFSFNLVAQLFFAHACYLKSGEHVKPLTKALFVIIPSALDWVIQTKYFHAHRPS